MRLEFFLKRMSLYIGISNCTHASAHYGFVLELRIILRIILLDMRILTDRAWLVAEYFVGIPLLLSGFPCSSVAGGNAAGPTPQPYRGPAHAVAYS